MANGEDSLNVILANETRADLVTMFRKNPGLADSVEGIARRIGKGPATIREDVAELVKLGTLRSEKVGSEEVISLDSLKDREVQDNIGEFLANVKPNSDEKDWD